MAQDHEESRLLPSTAIPSLNRGNAGLAIPANTDIERAGNYGSADLNGAVGLLVEIVNNHPVFLHDFIDFLIEKLNNDRANADTKKHIQQLKCLDKKFESSNSISINSYNISIQVLKKVFELNIFEEGAIDIELLNKSLTDLRIKGIEKPFREFYKDLNFTLPLWIALSGSFIALIAFLIYCAHFLTKPYGSNYGYQCFPCDNRASCFLVNTQDNKAYFPVTGYTGLTYISGVFELVAAIPMGISLLLFLTYLKSHKVTLNTLENLIENNWQKINRVAANLADYTLLLFNIIAAPIAAYLYYRASHLIYYTYDQYIRFINCSTSNSNLTLTYCHNFSGTIACNFDWSAARRHYNNQNKEVVFDIGLSTLLTVYSLPLIIMAILNLILAIKNYLNHASEASQKAHVSLFANPADIENRDVVRRVAQNYRANGIEAVELEDVYKKSAKISRAEVAQMLTIVRSHRP